MEFAAVFPAFRSCSGIQHADDCSRRIRSSQSHQNGSRLAEQPRVQSLATATSATDSFSTNKLANRLCRTPPCTGFSNRCFPKNARKTVPSVVPRCPYWCHTVFLVLSQFSPFCTPGTRGQGDGNGAKPRPINAKKPRVNSGFRGKTLHFEAFCRSGETGIRTLGTREGTPVFKTGAGVTLLVCQTSQ